MRLAGGSVGWLTKGAEGWLSGMLRVSGVIALAAVVGRFEACAVVVALDMFG
jgi:hypothetical protein